jgi:hypothetical protein
VGLSAQPTAAAQIAGPLLVQQVLWVDTASFLVSGGTLPLIRASLNAQLVDFASPPPSSTNGPHMRSARPDGEMDQRSKLMFDAGSNILVQAGPSINDRCTLDER